ncbi:hypothetical protein CRYUN_Cryun07bG0110800 [Craigia yunnanensis]
MAELEQLTKIFKELGLVAEKQEKRIQWYEKKAQHLTIAYLIFQGIVFISITSQVLSSQCQNWWVTFSLSLLSSLIYFLAFLNILTNFYRVKYQLDLISIEQETVNKQIHEAESHKIQIGESSCEQRPVCKLLKSDEVQLLKRKLCIIMIISALIASVVMVLLACKSFLCNQDLGFG